MSAEAPPKFITENGVKKMNPEFKKWKDGQGGGAAAAAATGSVAPVMKNEAVALPVVCNMQDFAQLGQGVQVNAAFQAAQHQYLQTAQQLGVPQESMMDKLGRVFAKYEIPMGLLAKLNLISEYNIIEYLIDDSGSMSARTDSKHPNGQFMTRWEEAKKNVSLMLEVLAYIAAPPVWMCFLNRSDRILFQKNPGETPEQFLPRALGILNQAFIRGPAGTTPYLERARESLARYPGQSVLRYWFGDGVPNGGDEAVEQICKLVKNRPNPQKNPITLVACTNNDADVEWMSNVEEESLFCSAIDDYGDESEEVVKDQGVAFPFSFGIWLMCLMIGSACPDDLDALDEGAPFPKKTLSAIAGYDLSTQDYDAYLNAFFDAQRKRPKPESNSDKIKAEYVPKFATIRDQFHNAANLSSIGLVVEYRKKLIEAKSSGCVIA